MRLSFVISLVLTFAPAYAAILDFSGDICTTNVDGSGGPGPCSANGAYISQGYGDSPNIDLTYFVTSPNGNATMSTWITPNTYSNLAGVGYGFFGATYASITFAPTAGNQVTLNSLNLGTAPPNVTRNTNILVIDLATNSTVFSTNVSVGATASLVSPNVTSAAGLELRYSPDTFNVALDNINFDVNAVSSSTVPEPSSLALLAMGIAGCIARFRKQRQN
jgi:hypothetical protein